MYIYFLDYTTVVLNIAIFFSMFFIFRMMASRVSLDSQARLILRENGKIILPYEHFANAVMLKHMNGPHGLHLGVEGTVRAVMYNMYFVECCLLIVNKISSFN